MKVTELKYRHHETLAKKELKEKMMKGWQFAAQEKAQAIQHDRQMSLDKAKIFNRPNESNL